MTTSVKSLFLSLICVLVLIFTDACRDKVEPQTPPVIYGREGDTCQLAKMTVGAWDYLQYEYANRRVRKITLHTGGSDYPCDLIYDGGGKLLKVSGKIMDTSYEYDAKGRVVRENRILHNDGVNVMAAHFSARIFEYNEADQVIKCSYVEGRGTEYSSDYVKKGEVYRYETYAYDVQGDVFAAIAYEREAKSEKFAVVSDYAFFYDKLINPFYGHPGIFDSALYFGFAWGNGPAVFSKHNVIRRVEKGFGVNTTYSYTSSKYPAVGTDVPWLSLFIDYITFEYTNCK